MIFEDKFHLKYQKINLNFIVYNHPSCIKLLENLKWILTHNWSIECTFVSIASKDLQILIFPITGDNRIPNSLETWINKNTNKLKTFICILGDFDIANNDAGQVVSQEVIRILETKDPYLISRVYPVDTPISCYATEAKNILNNIVSFINNKSSDNRGYISPFFFSEDSFYEISSNHPLFKNKYWKILCQILEQPNIKNFISIPNGISLILTDKNIYPRSIIYNKPIEVVQNIWDCIENIPYIVDLRVKFAEIDAWPQNTPKLYNRLIKLDLRGNNFNSFTFLHNFKKLKEINISANNLTCLPNEIFSLDTLEVIFAYKNSINNLDERIGKLVNLKRLSLYRNLLESLPSEISFCSKLEILNLGANPIQNLPYSLKQLKKLHNLGLRNCKLKHLPKVLAKMNLTSLDITKNLLMSSL